MTRAGHQITRAIFEENLAGKIHLPAFTDDVPDVCFRPGSRSTSQKAPSAFNAS